MREAHALTATVRARGSSSSSRSRCVKTPARGLPSPRTATELLQCNSTSREHCLHVLLLLLHLPLPSPQPLLGCQLSRWCSRALPACSRPGAAS